MNNSRNRPTRPVLKAIDREKNPAFSNGTKRDRKMLEDITNLNSNDKLQKKRKITQVTNGEDKENIPPNKHKTVILTNKKAAAVLSTKKASKPDQPQHFFPCDIKRNRIDGHLLPIEYLPSIMTAMFSNEKKSADLFPNPNYFLKQTVIRPWMRAKLYTWMTEVHLKFKLREVVLWASFQICDRFLSKANIPREKLQLVGCTSMWIACKYHEIYPPMAADMIYISANDFTKPDILDMECRICDTLSCRFSIPNACQFLERFTNVAIESIKETRLKKRVKWLARYGMERFHIDVKSLHYRPSMLAAGALCAALKLTSHPWTKSCVVVSGYSAKQLVPELKDHAIFHQIKKAIMDFDTTSHKAIIDKYKVAERGSVSELRKKENNTSRAR